MLKNLMGFSSADATATELLLEKLENAFDLASQIALYVTIAFIAAMVIFAIAIRNKDEACLARSRKIMLWSTVGYAALAIAVLGALKIACYVVDEKVNLNFWLMIGMFALVAIGIIVTVVLGYCKVRGYKWYGLGFAAAAAIYAIVLLCVIPAKKADYEPLSTWQMYLFSGVLTLAIVLSAIFGDKEKQSDFNTKSLTYAAICVATSFALSYVKFFSLPQGGSVTFASLLPLALYSYMFGTRKGVIAGVVYGLLQFIQSPQFYQPMQALLDYPIAFGAIGVAGIARSFKFLKGNVFAEFAIGTTIAVLLRYAAHVISGYFVFSSWAMEGYTAVSWAFVYNLFTIADLAIVLAVGLVALASKTVRRTIINVGNEFSAAE